MSVLALPSCFGQALRTYMGVPAGDKRGWQETVCSAPCTLCQHHRHNQHSCLPAVSMPFPQMAGDGPTLYVCFTVPEPLCNQVMQFNASSKTLQSCSHKLNPSALTVKFPAHEAYEHIMAQASAGRPALNLQ